MVSSNVNGTNKRTRKLPTILTCTWLLIANAIIPSGIVQVFPTKEECETKLVALKKDGITLTMECVSIDTVTAVAHGRIEKN